MQITASIIPKDMVKRLSESQMKVEDLLKLKENLNEIIQFLSR